MKHYPLSGHNKPLQCLFIHFLLTSPCKSQPQFPVQQLILVVAFTGKAITCLIKTLDLKGSLFSLHVLKAEIQ